jgi:hypothetical protein
MEVKSKKIKQDKRKIWREGKVVTLDKGIIETDGMKFVE